MRGKNRKRKKEKKTDNDTSYFEQGTIIKRGKNLIRTALVYPNTYKAGMSSLGFQTVYALINGIDSVACERVFLPAGKTKQNRIKSCETGMALSLFDIIAFSISFENDYVNLISILKNSGIPPRASSRDHSFPLVIAGGVACFLNPEPLAPFVDIFLLGEAEFLIREFFDLYDPAMDKDKLKHIMARELSGAYVPSFYSPAYTDSGQFTGIKPLYNDIPQTIKIRYVEDLDTIKTASVIVTPKTVFKNLFLIETGRGCPHGCRFCSAGFIYRPPRFYPEEGVINAMDEVKKMTDRIGLVSAAVSDHPGINKICATGIKKGFKISFSSLRVDALTDELINSLAMSGVKTATIAPEAGSEKMRRVINKKIKEDDILSAAERLVNAGIINLKLYFMIGLPFEQEDDVRAIVILTEKIMEKFLTASRKKKKIGTITLSINPFIPKPSTPFQWFPMAPAHNLKNRLKIIKQGLKTASNIHVKSESIRIARINALLSRGDRRMADILENASEKGWKRAIGQAQDYCHSQLHAERRIDDALAWDILDTGIKKTFLFKEYLRAEKEKTSDDCPMVQCEKCHVCR